MSLPTWDALRFSSWLRRWKDAEGLEWTEIAEASGLGYGTLMQLSRGTPNKQSRERGQKVIDPRITTIARLANGLRLEFGYVTSKGGLTPGHYERWANFEDDERHAIAAALRSLSFPTPEQVGLLAELESTFTEEVPTP